MRFTTVVAAMTVALTTPALVSSTIRCSGASACSDITSSLSSITLTPTNGSAYTQARNAGFNPLNNKLGPTCIVRPTTTADVSKTMRAVYKNNANYAVRAGGHTGMAGWDSVQGGVLIDFSQMTGFKYNEESATVSVEPGLRWGQIYSLAEQYGVCPMGGRVEHVGTGLILGGGLSLLSPQYGYACDGLVSAEVVMVDGTVKQVDASSDPQLLRAIKGGGGRFGIVTKYELKAFPTGKNTDKLWYGGTITTLTPEGMDQLVQATEQFVAAPDDPRATLLSNIGMQKLGDIPLYLGMAFLFYKGTKAEFSATFHNILSIPGLAIDVGPLSYLEAAKVMPLSWSDLQAYKWLGGALYPRPTSGSVLPTSWLHTWSNVRALLTKHEATIETGFWSLTPVRTTQIEQGYAAGGNALSPPRGRNYMHWLFSVVLAPNTTAFPHDLEHDRLEFLANNPSSKGLPLLLNEVDATQNTFRSYGWYDELNEQYKHVDPNGFSIQHQQGPAF